MDRPAHRAILPHRHGRRTTDDRPAAPRPGTIRRVPRASRTTPATSSLGRTTSTGAAPRTNASKPADAAKPAGPTDSVAFLLSSLGAEAGRRFADAVGPLGLEPREVGVLRAIAGDEGTSQQALARRLGTAPSGMVALVDELESAGLVERRTNPDDRRARALFLTPAGRRKLAEVSTAGQRHERDMCRGLTDAERAQLLSLLQRLAGEHGLDEVHPGLRTA
jgi:DNA-binding MarR family transcriptional regulator